jgi:hypothetical protein
MCRGNRWTVLFLQDEEVAVSDRWQLVSVGVPSIYCRMESSGRSKGTTRKGSTRKQSAGRSPPSPWLSSP